MSRLADAVREEPLRLKKLTAHHLSREVRGARDLNVDHLSEGEFWKEYLQACLGELNRTMKRWAICPWHALDPQMIQDLSVFRVIAETLDKHDLQYSKMERRAIDQNHKMKPFRTKQPSTLDLLGPQNRDIRNLDLEHKSASRTKNSSFANIV